MGAMPATTSLLDTPEGDRAEELEMPFGGGLEPTTAWSPIDRARRTPILDRIECPADLRTLDLDDLTALARELRAFIVESVSTTGGHLGSNLGAVELTLALHRVFESPRDMIVWDTGHQAYPHKILTGRREQFAGLRQAGGLSGYPSRSESDHDWVENSHASTAVSYAHGLATARDLKGEDRRVVAVVGDGALTGGMAYEGLNNLGHSGKQVVVVLNDNGRSYAPTVSRLTASSTNDTAAFFTGLGLRYVGPIDGHDLIALEGALAYAAEEPRPVLVHVLTEKGRGYRPAETDEEKCLHDTTSFDPATGPTPGGPSGYTKVFADAIVEAAHHDGRVVAITAAMPGSTGLLPFQARFPDRYVDVGIAEQHGVTAAAGMAMGGLRPVFAVYSTFFTRAFDQANLDVGLHGLPVIFALDRAGITGDDGPSHHGILDMALCLKVPGLTVFAPSSAQELPVMLQEALRLDGPAAIRYPKGPARQVASEEIGSGLSARRLRRGDGEVCILAVGKVVEAAEAAAGLLAAQGISATLWDVRVVKPLDAEMIADAACHRLVVTVEDGIRLGGAGTFMADAIGRCGREEGPPPVTLLGVPDEYLPHGKQEAVLAGIGLDGPGIAAATMNALDAVSRSSL